MWKLILQQDDCAPDSVESFKEEFLELIDMYPTEFKKKAKVYNSKDGFETIYELDNFKLEISADDPYWKLYEFQEEPTVRFLKTKINLIKDREIRGAVLDLIEMYEKK